MKILFVAGFAPITPDPPASKSLYVGALGLPLHDQDGYLSTESMDGVKHFGVWPLSAAAQSCFGSDVWPAHTPTPTATLEFELESSDAVADAVEELKRQGTRFIHAARTEPWGQTVARFMSPEGVLIGLSHAPWLHRKSE